MSDYHSPEFHFDYSDLDTLCADRELVTPELHATNDFYGQASVLKRFAGLDEGNSLKGVVEHGINIDDQMWDHDRDATLSHIFSPSGWRARRHRELSGKVATPIGFGYLYARDLLDRIARPVSQRAGTLAFPCHSTHTIHARFDHADYAERLAGLPDWMQPVSVCMYWKNYLMGEAREYVSRGLRVVSAGHMFDRDFMLRLHDLARHHLYATANEMGSHLFLTVASGCRFVFTRSTPVRWEVPADEVANCSTGNPLYEANCRRAWDLFGAEIPGPDESGIPVVQQAFVDEFIGTAHQKSAEKLRATFRRAERSFQMQQLRRWAAGRWRKIGRLRYSIAKRMPWRKAA